MNTISLLPGLHIAYEMVRNPLRLSTDGRFMSFVSREKLAATDTYPERDVYRMDLDTGQIALASATAAGISGTDLSAGFSTGVDISASGNRLVFITYAKELSGSLVSHAATVVKDVATGALFRADSSAAGVGADKASKDISISDDGRYVGFTSYAANLVPGDLNASADVFVKDLLTGAIVNASTAANGEQAQNESYRSSLSGDGKFVVFSSYSRNLSTTPLPYAEYVYVKNLVTGALTLASSNAAGQAMDYSASGAISSDGRVVAFTSLTQSLSTSTPSPYHVYAKDMQSGQLWLVSSDRYGTPGNGHSGSVDLSADGRFAVFSSIASNLVPGDTNGQYDIFIKDMLTGAIERLSVSNTGVQANEESASVAISGDGKVVTFRSAASNLTPNDTNGVHDAFRVSIDPAFLNAWEDVRYGGSGNETLLGGAGSERFMGQGGNDAIDGGAGIDTALLRNARSSYTIVADGPGYTITDKTGLDGVDVLRNIERLHFLDADLALDINGLGGQAYRIYQAAFNRTPDMGGLGFWMAQMDQGTSLERVAESFMGSPEFIKMYGATPGNAALVEKFYTNVLHRPGEAAGVQYWTGALDSKAVTPSQVLAMISESAENQAALIGVLQNGFLYLPYGA